MKEKFLKIYYSGYSDIHINRSLVEWPNDVQVLLDFLNFKQKIALAGGSLGGLHAAVTAAKLSDRFSAGLK